MTMLEVAEFLGPPDWWMGSEPGAMPVPSLWGYGPFLEIFFERAPPYAVKVIKFRQRPPAVSKRAKIRSGFWVAADGIYDLAIPSDLLRLPLWKHDVKAVVGISSKCANIDILTDNVRIVWHMWDDESEFLEQKTPTISKSSYMKQRDRLSVGFHGIYSCRAPKGDRAPSDGWEEFSVEEYLALVD